VVFVDHAAEHLAALHPAPERHDDRPVMVGWPLVQSVQPEHPGRVPACTHPISESITNTGPIASRHWLVYGIPPGISSMAAAPAGAAQGVNGFGRRGYGGPCPPRGAAHHYQLVVLALDSSYVGVSLEKGT
jgi:hypothetical protein